MKQGLGPGEVSVEASVPGFLFSFMHNGVGKFAVGF